MPRKKVKKTNHANFTADEMKNAVEDVLQKKMSVRASAKANGVDRTTLSKYLKDAKANEKTSTSTSLKKNFVTTQVS